MASDNLFWQGRKFCLIKNPNINRIVDILVCFRETEVVLGVGCFGDRKSEAGCGG
jgi:hypothetical protein